MGMAAANNTPKIVVSYRRADSAMSGRIFDRLVERFGQNSLFIDIDNIPFGGDFRKHIADALTSSDLLVAVIGREWLGRRENAPARIMNAADPVRVEIETAMRSSVPILPVLIDGAMMPDPEQLPDGIKEFAFLNELEIESGRDFKVHIQRLFGAVAQLLGGKVAAEEAVAPGTPVGLLSPTPAPVKNRKRSLLPIILGSLLLAALLGGTLWFLLRERSSSQSGGPRPRPISATRSIASSPRRARNSPAFSARNPPAYGPRAFRRRAGRTAPSAIGLMKARRPAITHARFRPTRRSMRSMHASMSSASM
jgi:TIR domain